MGGGAADARAGLKIAALNAARMARDALAASLNRAPELGERIWIRNGVTLAIGELYAAEVYVEHGDDELQAKLGAAVSHLGSTLTRVHTSPSPSSAIDELSASIARALAILHPAWSALERVERPDNTAPFPLEKPHPNDERREQSRVSVKAHVGMESDTHFYTGVTGDVSDGGLFVATEELLPKGTEVTLSFVLPDGEQVTALGRVAWVRDDESGSRGMGLALGRLTAKQEQAIQSFVRRREPLSF